ncbi:hypothetical protein [Aquimarina latercula]|uniref:hypothetical protein n=1 Tax=Aquimarina latercula TaxID=987 RepID=UPI0004202215|nr:hypothetical protein [Aquimarina latercula]
MTTIKKLPILILLFSLILVSCRDTKKEEPEVEIKTEKVDSITDEENTEEENTETEDTEENYNEEENEIEESEEETDTLSVEE